MRSYIISNALAVLCTVLLASNVVSYQQNGSYLRRNERSVDMNKARILSKGKGSNSSKVPKSKGKGGKGSSKAPKSGKKGNGSSKSPHSKVGKGGKGSSKAPKSSSKSTKSSKSSKSSKSPKSYKCSKKGKGHGCTPVSSPSAPNAPTEQKVPTSSPVTTPITFLPTITPILSCTELSKVQKTNIIKQFLLEITSSDVLNDNTSAQFEAAKFMYEQDLPCPTVIERTSVKQRFSLAALYYSTEGNNWNFCGENNGECNGHEFFLSESSECDWYGITCEDGQITKIDFEPIGGENVGIRGSLPDEIFLLPKLLELKLEFETTSLEDRGNLGGFLPATIGQAPNLKTIDLDKHQLKGPIPTELYNAATLREIDLDNNFLTGSITNDIAKLVDLSFFTVGNNPFDESPIPAAFGNLPNLRVLGLNDANLIGAVPNTFANLDGLRFIDLSGNQLSGSIDFIDSWSKIESLTIDNNNFSGPIPVSLWTKPSLSSIILSENGFNGQIPAEIGNLTELKTLLLVNTGLSGLIPQEINNLTSLEILYLQGNFTGEISQTLCNSNKIKKIVISSGITCPQNCCNTI